MKQEGALVTLTPAPVPCHAPPGHTPLPCPASSSLIFHALSSLSPLLCLPCCLLPHVPSTPPTRTHITPAPWQHGPHWEGVVKPAPPLPLLDYPHGLMATQGGGEEAGPGIHPAVEGIARLCEAGKSCHGTHLHGNHLPASTHPTPKPGPHCPSNTCRWPHPLCL